MQRPDYIHKITFAFYILHFGEKMSYEPNDNEHRFYERNKEGLDLIGRIMRDSNKVFFDCFTVKDAIRMFLEGIKKWAWTAGSPVAAVLTECSIKVSVFWEQWYGFIDPSTGLN